jgi:amino acid permease
MTSKILIGAATLVGSAIGAGILGIPYVIQRSGFYIGITHLVLLTAIMTYLVLCLGEIALRTKQNHQLTGYAEKYIGSTGKKITFIAFAFGIYAALIAYLIGEGQSISQLIFNTPSFSFHLGVAFWLLLCVFSYTGLKTLEKGEEIGVLLILAFIVGLAIFASTKINPANLTTVNPAELFTPFGVILFAVLGFSALPEVERELGNQKKHLKKSITIAYVTIFLVYLIFAVAVVGWQGSATPQVATLALGKPFILLGILTMFTSYLALTFAMMDTLRFDFHYSKTKAWLTTNAIPLILYIILTATNTASFTAVLSVGGVISGGLMAILILIMHPKAKRLGDEKPAYHIPHSKIISTILILIFVLAAAQQIWQVLV